MVLSARSLEIIPVVERDSAGRGSKGGGHGDMTPRPIRTRWLIIIHFISYRKTQIRIFDSF